MEEKDRTIKPHVSPGDLLEKIMETRSKKIESLPTFEADCYTGDIRGTKMWANRHFVSGDGGYQYYINNVQPQNPLPSYTL